MEMMELEVSRAVRGSVGFGQTENPNRVGNTRLGLIKKTIC